MTTEVASPMWVGFIPFSIIVGSLSLAVLSSVLIRPVGSRTTLIFVGTIFLLLSVLVVGTWAGGVFFSTVIP